VSKRLLAGAAILAVVLTAAGGCSATKDLSVANDAVTRFHGQLGSQDFGTIYSQADQRFRDSISQPDFLAFMNAVHTKLGNVATASRQGFFVNYNTSGTQIRMTYATKFAGGDGQEEFVWVKSGDGLVLLGYHINSMALITK
jgi:hypothetical protein